MKLYGKNPVLERIKAAPGTIRDLYLQKRTDLSEIVKEAKRAGITFKSVDKAWFPDRCGDVHTQGVMAEIDEFTYASFPRMLSDCLNGAVTPVFLDGVSDPQNLGAIIRNLACLGGFAIVLSEHGSAHVTETVLRVASGGENYIKIAKVTNIATAVKKAREEGIWIAGAVVDGKDILAAELAFPMAVVIGSEGKGVRPGVKKYIDAAVSLPMRGASLSYNVAVATALFCYEVYRRKAQRA